MSTAEWRLCVSDDGSRFRWHWMITAPDYLTRAACSELIGPWRFEGRRDDGRLLTSAARPTDRESKYAVCKRCARAEERSEIEDCL